MPEEVDPADEMFDPRRGPIYVRGDGAEARLKVLSWLPTRGVNKRLDYLRRVLAAVGEPGSGMDARDGAGRLLAGADRGTGRLAARHGPAQARPGASGRPHVAHARAAGRAATVWQCDAVPAGHRAALRGVCPTLGCAGDLGPAGRADDDDHYRALYRQTAPVLADRPRAHRPVDRPGGRPTSSSGSWPARSTCCPVPPRSSSASTSARCPRCCCATCRRPPPTTSSGPAGPGVAAVPRRSSLTYAQRRSHDLSRYAEPESMLTGQVRAPYVPLGNPADRPPARAFGRARRLLPRRQGQRGPEWKTAGDFFLPAGGGEPPVPAGPRLPHPGARRGRATALRAVLPEPVMAADRHEPTAAGWTSLPRCWSRSAPSSPTTSATFEERRTEAFAARRSDLAARFERSINTITRRSLIGFLANRNILPKYGFPVDTVELRTAHCDSQVGARLELNRDLSVAIHEYAPGAEAGRRRRAVADGRDLPAARPGADHPQLHGVPGLPPLPGRRRRPGTGLHRLRAARRRPGPRVLRAGVRLRRRPAHRQAGPRRRRSAPGTAPCTWCRSARNSPRSAGRPGRARWRGATPARVAGWWRWPRVRAAPGS